MLTSVFKLSPPAFKTSLHQILKLVPCWSFMWSCIADTTAQSKHLRELATTQKLRILADFRLQTFAELIKQHSYKHAHPPKKKKKNDAALLIPEEVDFNLPAACPWMSQLCRENTSKLAQCQAYASSRSELSLSTHSSDDHGGHNPARVKQLRVLALCSSWIKSIDSILSYKGVFSFVHPTSGTVCKAGRRKQRHSAPAHPPQLVMPPEAWLEGISRSPLVSPQQDAGVWACPTAYTELHSPQVSVHQ